MWKNLGNTPDLDVLSLNWAPVIQFTHIWPCCSIEICDHHRPVLSFFPPWWKMSAVTIDNIHEQQLIAFPFRERCNLLFDSSTPWFIRRLRILFVGIVVVCEILFVGFACNGRFFHFVVGLVVEYSSMIYKHSEYLRTCTWYSEHSSTRTPVCGF